MSEPAEPTVPSPDSPHASPDDESRTPAWQDFSDDDWDDSGYPTHYENSEEIEEARLEQLYRDEQRRKRQDAELQEPAPPAPAEHTHQPDIYPRRVSVSPGAIGEHGIYIRTYVDPEGLDALTESIRATGRVEQPIGVRWAGESSAPTLALVYGKRRWLGALQADLTEIEATHYGWISDVEALLLQALENEERANPHPVDRAIGFAKLVGANVSQAAIVRHTGLSPSFISVMSRIGDTILQLTEQERARLYKAPDAKTPRFEAIVTLPTEKQLEALRAMITPAALLKKRSRRKSGHTSKFKGGYYKVRPTPDGAAVELIIRVATSELKKNPAAVSRRVKEYARRMPKDVEAAAKNS